MSVPQEVEYESTVIVADDTLAEVFLALMPKSTIILYSPDTVSGVVSAIPCSLFLIVLCDVDAAVYQRGASTCREIRAVLPTCTSAQRFDGVTYFDINDFFNHVPVPQDMFSVYMFDKIMTTTFKCCYRPKMYDITPESGQHLLDGIRMTGRTVSNAIDGMVAEGVKNFSIEAEYTTLGKFAPVVHEHCMQQRLAASTRAFAGSSQTMYRIVLGAAKQDNVISATGFTQDGIRLEMPCETMVALGLVDIADMQRGVYYETVIPYGEFPKVFSFVPEDSADDADETAAASDAAVDETAADAAKK